MAIGRGTRATGFRAATVAIAVVAVVLAVAPVVWSVATVTRPWAPTSDTAMIVARARDVPTRHSPLVGMPTTLSEEDDETLHHLGPLESWLLAVPARLPWAEAPLLAVATVNAAVLVALVGVAGWLGGRWTALVTGGVAFAALWPLRGEVLTDPWNPYAALLPFAGFLAAVVAALAGRRWALPVAVLAGSYAAQAHLSLVPVVAGVAVAAGAWAAWRRWRTGPSTVSGAGRGPLLAAAAVGAVAWTPVLIDQATGGHNLSRVLGASGDRGAGSGIDAASAAVRNVVGPLPGWSTARLGPASLLRPPGASDLLDAPGVVPTLATVAVLAGACFLAWRARQRPAASAPIVVALAGLVAGTLLVSRLPAELFSALSLHNYLWLWPLSALLWVGLWALPGRHRPAVAVVVAAAVAVAVVSPAAGSSTPLAPAVPPLADQLEDRLDPGGRYLVDLRGSLHVVGVGLGLVVELDRRGFDVVVEEGVAAGLGDHWGAGRAPVDGTLVVGASVGPGAPAGAVARRPPGRRALRRLAEARADLGPVDVPIDQVIGAYVFDRLPQLDADDVRRLRRAEAGRVWDVWVTLAPPA